MFLRIELDCCSTFVKNFSVVVVVKLWIRVVFTLTFAQITRLNVFDMKT